MVQKNRKAIGALIVSTIAIAGIATREGFTDHAVIPIPGDRPTYGYGSTYKLDGSAVKIGDTIDRSNAAHLLIDTVNWTYAAGILKCAPDLVLTQYEFDFLVDSAYNLGVNAVCKSGMVRNFRAGNYEKGCQTIKQYVYAAGKDCRVASNKCGGIPKDRERAYNICIRGDYGVPSREEATIAAKRVQKPELSN